MAGDRSETGQRTQAGKILVERTVYLFFRKVLIVHNERQKPPLSMVLLYNNWVY
jgi:hypothetical protein